MVSDYSRRDILLSAAGLSLATTLVQGQDGYERNLTTAADTLETFCCALKASDFDGLLSIVAPDFVVYNSGRTGNQMEQYGALLASLLLPVDIKIGTRQFKRVLDETKIRKVVEFPLDGEACRALEDGELKGTGWGLPRRGDKYGSIGEAIGFVDLSHKVSWGGSIGQSHATLYCGVRKSDKNWLIEYILCPLKIRF